LPAIVSPFPDHQGSLAGGPVFGGYYTYDAASRLTAEILNGTTTSYTHDNTNQLTSDGASSYSDDANGNHIMAGYQTGTGNCLGSGERT
jgi:hypothetical protein